ncbi:phosphate ABC transporter substrate-binding protein [Pseudomonas sp. BN414]|uniref:phosphate/phosphite/phosphonate ABC transporter substrate-binding protein n=1 Tax=Pseudomonas sp. BN414 TaxID=2567888 RepID=UPI002456E045|nr:PhnD/SsuA/transferrin family substrate-binding protein [Pseudomonas sp. BN414]MDH4565333.1 phosphate ABC transporter substrate-binding protein [Pseudomonas sp. BN414]
MRHAELLMYVAPQCVENANTAWLQRILELLGEERLTADGLSLPELWTSPRLLLTQTCGYPLMTQLRGQVRVLGRPDYVLPDSADGWHCSLILARAEDARTTLEAFLGSRGAINDAGSNTGMNLFRHRLAPLQQRGTFFSNVIHSGSHRESLRLLRENQADLAAVDSVTYAHLARYAPTEVANLRLIERSAPSPSLPYIGSVNLGNDEAERLREAMNQALNELPQVAEILSIREVLPAKEDDYRILLDYQQQAIAHGYAELR